MFRMRNIAENYDGIMKIFEQMDTEIKIEKQRIR